MTFPNCIFITFKEPSVQTTDDPVVRQTVTPLTSLKKPKL